MARQRPTPDNGRQRPLPPTDHHPASPPQGARARTPTCAPRPKRAPCSAQVPGMVGGTGRAPGPPPRRARPKRAPCSRQAQGPARVPQPAARGAPRRLPRHTPAPASLAVARGHPEELSGVRAARPGGGSCTPASWRPLPGERQGAQERFGGGSLVLHRDAVEDSFGVVSTLYCRTTRRLRLCLFRRPIRAGWTPTAARRGKARRRVLSCRLVRPVMRAGGERRGRAHLPPPGKDNGSRKDNRR